jgi:hypothetical protein
MYNDTLTGRVRDLATSF